MLMLLMLLMKLLMLLMVHLTMMMTMEWERCGAAEIILAAVCLYYGFQVHTTFTVVAACLVVEHTVGLILVLLLIRNDALLL